MSDRWKKLSVTSGIVTGTLIALVTVVTLAPAAQGCEDDPRNALCCSEFTVGADLSNVDFDVDAALQGRYTAVAQAASDVGATSTAMVNDVASACHNIAVGLGADPHDDAAAGKTGAAAATAWCDLAKAQIAANAALQAAGSLSVDYEPPTCRASLDAQAECQGRCQVDANCDPGSVEVRCQEGNLSGKCSGTCTGACEGSVTAAAECEGSCQAECRGSCDGNCVADVNASVNCQGACDGKCTGTCDGGNADGINCAGDCVGQCQGSCDMAADAAVQCNGKCEGTCSGKCTGHCEFAADAEIQCDGTCHGECTVDFKAPKCEGEVVPPSCDAEADCHASCNASLEATAECSPPSLTITAEGQIEADAELNLAITTLKANLPTLIIAAEGRGQALIDSISSLSDNGDEFFDASISSAKGVACGVAIIGTIGEATANATAAFNASASVLAEVKGT